MTIADNDKKFGFFWLPSDPNGKNKASGFLSIQDNGRIELEIMNPPFLTGKNEIGFGSVPRIVGQIEAFRGGSYVTMDNCYCHKHKYNNGISTDILRVETAFVGVQYEENEVPQFNTFCFQVEGLNQWITNTGMKPTSNINRDHWTIEYEKPKEIILNINSDIQLIIGHKWQWSQENSITQLKSQVTEDVYCKLISTKEKSLAGFITLSQQIHFFLCFIMNDIVCLNDVTATSNIIKNQHNKPADIKIYYQTRPFITNSPKMIVPLVLFEYMQNNNIDIEKILKKWIEICNKTEPALKLYLSTQAGDYRFLENIFLTLIQTLECYQQRMVIYKNQPTTKKILQDIIKSLEKIINFDEKDPLIDKIMNKRNYFTHYNPKKESTDTGGEILFNLCLQLEGLLQITLLKDLEFSTSQIQSIIDMNKSGPSNKQLAHKVRLLEGRIEK